MSNLKESILAVTLGAFSFAVANEILQFCVLVVGLAAGIHAYYNQIKGPKKPKS